MVPPLRSCSQNGEAAGVADARDRRRREGEGARLRDLRSRSCPFTRLQDRLRMQLRRVALVPRLERDEEEGAVGRGGAVEEAEAATIVVTSCTPSVSPRISSTLLAAPRRCAGARPRPAAGRSGRGSPGPRPGRSRSGSCVPRRRRRTAKPAAGSPGRRARLRTRPSTTLHVAARSTRLEDAVERREEAAERAPARASWAAAAWPTSAGRERERVEGRDAPPRSRS